MRFQMEECKEMNNLSLVKKFAENEILEIIKKRYESGLIYTMAGPALVSVNPNKALELYGSTQKKKAQEDNEYPHIFTIAEKAYRGVLQEKNQVIILSGESGSGKSVNANYILEYLSDRSERANIGKRLVYASPILELFGNACTENNQNSSRFGKYVEVYYLSGQIVGANIKAFLLEKGRAQEVHDNFHSMVLLGDLLKDSADKTESFKRLSDVLYNFYQVGVSKAEVKGLFKSLLLVAYLVKTKITESENCCTIEGNAIGKAAEILEIPEEEIRTLLLEQRLKMGAEVLIKKKTREQAEASKNTLIRVVYEKVFENVVFLVNKALQTEKKAEEPKEPDVLASMKFMEELLDPSTKIELSAVSEKKPEIENEKVVKIGVLDIYGFEIMKENGFDQLCINYANEKIQAEYVRRVISENLKAFREEGIELDNVSSLAHAESVFEGSLGLITLLDEESFIPGGSVENWLNKLSSTGTIRTRKSSMEIEHYAGPVCYSAEDFVKKNKNSYSDICSLLNSTKIYALHQPAGHVGRLTRIGVIGEFQKSLQGLLEEINKNVLHYVRCIKPGKSDGFTDQYVKTQLKHTGIFETVKIFMLGFYVKTTKEEFISTYLIDPADVSGVQVGNKYVFLTEKVYNVLEAEKKKREDSAASIIKVYIRSRIILKKAEIAKRLTDKKNSTSDPEQIIEESNLTTGLTDNTGIKTSDHNKSQNTDVINSSPVEKVLAPVDCSVWRDPAASTSPASDDNVVFLDAQRDRGEDRCANCYKVEEKYSMQLLYLAEKESEVGSLRSDLQMARESLKEKDSLIRDLSHKIEVMLYELSSGEYFKTTTNPQQSVRGAPLSLPHQDKKPLNILFKQIAKIFIQSISPSYSSYYSAVCCSFALFRIAAICNGGISENISVLVKEFEAAAYAVLVVKKSSIPLYTGFFLTNAIFIARTSPSARTSEMLQSIFAEGCKAICEEIVNFGFDFLFKPHTLETINLLSRLLKKPSLDSVVSHLRMVHAVLNSLYVPGPVIISLFEYIAKTIDALGFEYITRKEKKITAKNLVYLHNSLNTLSSLLLDVNIEDPYACFPYLRKFTEFVEMQKKGLVTGSVFLQLGPFSSSQLKACINALAPEIRGQLTVKLENALRTAPSFDKIVSPSPVFSMPLNALPDNPNELYNALFECPEKEALCRALEEFNISSSWLM